MATKPNPYASKPKPGMPAKPDMPEARYPDMPVKPTKPKAKDRMPMKPMGYMPPMTMGAVPTPNSTPDMPHLPTGLLPVGITPPNYHEPYPADKD